MPTVPFTFNGKDLKAVSGEPIATALIANGIDVFTHHHRDKAPLGIFCANGQCSQCNVYVCGKGVVKSCVTRVAPGMHVQSLDNANSVGPTISRYEPSSTKDVEVLIIGGGPAGISASFSLHEAGVENVLLVDDREALGGKLLLQSHCFFGSVEETHAGTRGYKIAQLLAEKLAQLSGKVEVWTDTSAVGVFEDGTIGLVKKTVHEDESVSEEYILVRPRHVLSTVGARERSLTFPGNTLPGVYGAGAFQTLVNRDLVRAADKVLILGGGNVGLVAGYHAIQAGIKVAAAIEGMPKVGGYKVHADKLARLGVPILCRHTVLRVEPNETGDRVGAVVTAKIDDRWQPIAGSEVRWEVDALLVAVGLAPISEIEEKCRRFGIPVTSAGDASSIAEASSAMFTGKVAGRDLALMILGTLPPSMTDGLDRDMEREHAETLAAPAGAIHDRDNSDAVVPGEVRPVLHCFQEIACDACRHSCPKGVIQLHGGVISGIPESVAGSGDARCIGCLRCVSKCPGLAVTVVDYRDTSKEPLVSMPCELPGADVLAKDALVHIVGERGEQIGRFPVERVRRAPGDHARYLVSVRIPKAHAWNAVACIPCDGGEPVLGAEPAAAPAAVERPDIEEDSIICRCERVTVSTVQETCAKIVARIEGSYAELGLEPSHGPRGGVVVDTSAVKAILRVGMGACGGNTCSLLLPRVMSSVGSSPTPLSRRPLFVETFLGTLSTSRDEDYTRLLVPPHPSYLTDPRAFMEILHKTAPKKLVPSVFDGASAPTDIECDVVVLGCGSMGLGFVNAAAVRNRELAAAGERPLRVIALDAGTGVSQFSGKAAIGGVRATVSVPAKVQLLQRSLEIFRNWSETAPAWEGVEEANLDTVRSGYLFPAYTDAIAESLKKVVAEQNANAAASLHPPTGIRWITPEEVAKIVPNLSLDGLRGATWSPNDIVTSPLRWAESVVRRAVHVGTDVHIITQANICKIDVQPEGVCIVAARTGVDHVPTGEFIRIHAKRCVEALGGAANLVLEQSGLPLIPVFPDSHEAAITAPSPRLSEIYAPSRTGLDQVGSPMIVDMRKGPDTSNYYFYVNREGQLIFCSTPNPAVPGLGTDETSRFLSGTPKRVVEIFPDAAECSVRRVWRGVYPMTPDGLPLFGWGATDAAGKLFHLNGACGHGFMLAPGSGELAVDCVFDSLGVDSGFFNRDVRVSVLDAFDVSRDVFGARGEVLH
eukprot:gnl/Chilomastix_cuspidata/650.p1 GENE.gnl/Chilomastix_cuspidata/650~~gnl/Chilomastix_cuspidata/650.p1  ORF type:complete len:1219 (+),score=263.33 gnl/Chilomastix_cuspidata/650:130-3786(+)